MTWQTYKMNVAGPDHHQPELASLMTEPNPDYNLTKAEMIDDLDLDDRVYQFEITTCALQIRHESGNPYDPAALQVFADGVFIGYVPRGNLQLLDQISRRPSLSMYVEVYGGKYKYLEHDDEADPFLEFQPKHFKVLTGSTPYRATMFFRWKV